MGSFEVPTLCGAIFGGGVWRAHRPWIGVYVRAVLGWMRKVTRFFTGLGDDCNFSQALSSGKQRTGVLRFVRLCGDARSIVYRPRHGASTRYALTVSNAALFPSLDGYRTCFFQDNVIDSGFDMKLTTTCIDSDSDLDQIDEAGGNVKEC